MPKVKPIKQLVLVLLENNTFHLVPTNLPSSFFPDALSEYGITNAILIAVGVATQRGDYFYLGKHQIGHTDRKGDFYVNPRGVSVFPREPIYNNTAVNLELYRVLLANLKK